MRERSRSDTKRDLQCISALANNIIEGCELIESENPEDVVTNALLI
jgi:hypothetical protein